MGGWVGLGSAVAWERAGVLAGGKGMCVRLCGGSARVLRICGCGLMGFEWVRWSSGYVQPFHPSHAVWLGGWPFLCGVLLGGLLLDVLACLLLGLTG